MGLFSKKETLIQNMTFMGIFSAINVVISLLTSQVMSAMLTNNQNGGKNNEKGNHW